MKIRIIAGGIFGALGELPIGTELEVREAPAGWAGRYEIVGKEPAKEAQPVTNPAKDEEGEKPTRRARPKD
ncbi:hypothetical protein [Sphingobium sp. UBA5915]|uniref:hypothetical protein n=1 Tax=Sphingobium sp. UBA5915 TaxID=1947530 RepID=UPI0025EA069D|nr:hypothetical protein [Sphingobium sp. UBA5915]